MTRRIMSEEKMEWREGLSSLNKELEERIIEANEDKTLIKWSKLLPDLMTADILVVGQFAGGNNANGDKAVGLLLLQKDGKEIVPFFTNPERINALVSPAKNNCDVMRINAARFFKSIKGRTAVLNPFSPCTRVFSPFEIKVLGAEYIDKAPPVENSSDEEKPE